MPPKARSRVLRPIAMLVLVVAALATAWFALRTTSSFRLLQSAQAVGQPHVSSLRAWMTLRYVADTYRVAPAALTGALALPAETAPDTSLKSLAQRAGASPFDYVRHVQQVLASLLPPNPHAGSLAAGSSGGAMDWVISALLEYRYPAFALVLFLGAVGLPLPTGLSAALIGSLVALGQMNWLAASAIAVGASILGDAGGYGIGRLIGDHVLVRHGRWIGYTPKRRERLGALFAGWGGLTILLTRTFASSLSALVNLFAGASRYRMFRFIGFDLAGRLLWTSAYVGLGYVIAGDVEAAAEFLKNLTGLLVSIAAVAALVLALSARGAPASDAAD